VTVLKFQLDDYIKAMKKIGYNCREFKYDIQAYKEKIKKSKELNDIIKKTQNMHENSLRQGFCETFVNMIHLKVMRAYIDGILRFGVGEPMSVCVLHPRRGGERPLLKKLTETFAVEEYKEMYGTKEETGDEDFFPFVAVQLNSPAYLM
jgi:hypothetical protein